MNKALLSVKTYFGKIGHHGDREIDMKHENEVQANKYVSISLVLMGIVIFILFLFFINNMIFEVPVDVEPVYMVLMPTMCAMMLVPFALTFTSFVESPWFKIIALSLLTLTIVLCFTITPAKTILLWCLPVFFVAHFFNPKLSRWYFLITILCLIGAYFLGLFFGEWDANMFGFTLEDYGLEDTLANRFFVFDAYYTTDGLRIYGSIFLYFVLPTIAILLLAYYSTKTLASRTYDLTNELAQRAVDNQRVETEFNAAWTIQSNSLPSNFPNDTRIDLYAKTQPAKTIGGDFYDFYYIDSTHFLFLVADVSGKGIPAAMFMMQAKTVIDSLSHTSMNFEETISSVNKQLIKGNDALMFVTAWIGVLNVENGLVHYINAGHNYPVVKKANGETFFLKSKPNCFLGVNPNVKYDDNTYQLEEGDEIILYTDGVNEAQNAKGEFYGNDRFLESVKDSTSDKALAVVNNIFSDTEKYVDGFEQSDDITVLCMRYHTKSDSHSLVVTSEINNASTVVSFIKDTLGRYSSNSKAIGQICIATDEIFSNISKFAYSPGIGDICVDINVTPDNIAEVTFIDSGRDFNPLNRNDPNLNTYKDENKVGGLGIYLVKNLMDTVNYEHKDYHNILKISKKL